MLVNFPEALLVDATYKTNRFNQYNSCYIEAPLQLLLHPIMPIISVFGSASAPSVDNTFDGILWEASKNPCLPSFRNFVWGSEDRFKKADESYVLSFCEYLLDDFLSEEFERNFVFKSNE